MPVKGLPLNYGAALFMENVFEHKLLEPTLALKSGIGSKREFRFELKLVHVTLSANRL